MKITTNTIAVSDESTNKNTQKRAQMTSMITLFLLVISLAYLAWTNYQAGGMDTVKTGLVGGCRFFLNILRLIVIFSLISGQISAHNVVKPQYMKEKLAGDSTIRAAVAGMVTAGGSTLGPVLQEKWNGGGNKFAIIACLISLSLLNWTTLLFRISFFGEKLTIIIFVVGLGITGVSICVLALLQRLNIVF